MKPNQPTITPPGHPFMILCFNDYVTVFQNICIYLDPLPWAECDKSLISKWSKGSFEPSFPSPRLVA